MLRAALHPTTLEALKGKLRVLQNEHRSTIEALESSKATQQEEIQRTKDENRQLRARLQQLQEKLARLELNDRRDYHDGDASGQQQLLQHEVGQARKEGDDVKMKSLQLQRELDELKDQVRTLDLQLRPASTPGASATGASGNRSPVAGLEEAIQRALTQHGEAQEIRATYEQIVKRLKAERVGFDQQIAALERTLSVKQHDLQELELLSTEATRARDAAQSELGKQKAACEQERAQREAALREKQQLIQQRLRRRKEARHAAARTTRPSVDADGASDEEGRAGGAEADDPPYLAESDLDDDTAGSERLAERKKQLVALQHAHRRVKVVMGIGTVEGVAEKVAAQAETLESLGAASRDNQALLERLLAERAALRTAVQQSRFAPTKPARSQEDVTAAVARGQERLGHLQLKQQQLAKLLKRIECSAQHLLHQLRPAASVPPAASPSPPPSPSPQTAVETETAAVGALREIELAVQRMLVPQQQD